MPPHQRNIKSQIEKLIYGLISLAIIIIVFAAFGVVIMLENKEAFVVYCIIIVINLVVIVAGFLFLRWFRRLLDKTEE